VDNVVVCAGQEPVRDPADELRRVGVDPHIIGGAALAAELDAKRAIQQGTALAARLGQRTTVGPVPISPTAKPPGSRL
jgi:2,4-dienoyl-CoA reductase (NADPH2)